MRLQNFRYAAPRNPHPLRWINFSWNSEQHRNIILSVLARSDNRLTCLKNCLSAVPVHRAQLLRGTQGQYRYSSTISLTSALDGVGGERHDPAALPLGKTRYPLYRRLGGPQARSGLIRKISPLPGFDPRTVQPVASRYTD